MKTKTVISLVVILVVLGIGFFGYIVYLDNQQIAQTPQQIGQTAGWNVVKNNELGFSFKYPADFGSKYASLATPIATVLSASLNSQNIKANGCFVADNPSLKEWQVDINNMQFCVGSVSDPGAGQLYNTYNYTTLRNGNYIVLQYVVHTLNGCSPYMGTPDYQPCTDFLNNYETHVAKVIEASVATLTFTK